MKTHPSKEGQGRIRGLLSRTLAFRLAELAELAEEEKGTSSRFGGPASDNAQKPATKKARNADGTLIKVTSVKPAPSKPRKGEHSTSAANKKAKSNDTHGCSTVNEAKSTSATKTTGMLPLNKGADSDCSQASSTDDTEATLVEAAAGTLPATRATDNDCSQDPITADNSDRTLVEDLARIDLKPRTADKESQGTSPPSKSSESDDTQALAADNSTNDTLTQDVADNTTQATKKGATSATKTLPNKDPKTIPASQGGDMPEPLEYAALGEAGILKATRRTLWATKKVKRRWDRLSAGGDTGV
ncbi:MAG: hypothetical protein Q9181_007046 [Wetmoreana brouardii]